MPVDWPTLWRSLGVAGLATAIALVLALWLAWVLVNREFPGKRAVRVILSFALILPAPIVCYAIFFAATGPALVAAGILSAAPMLARGARAAFASLDPAYGKSARSLGAAEWRVFAWVELPLASRPILGVTALAFVRVLAELAVVSVIGRSTL